MEDKELIREEFEKLAREGTLVIVEGKKDIAALAKIGITNVVEVKGPLYKCAEDVAEMTDQAIILTDLDIEGRKIYSELKYGLTRLGVKTDDSLRELLFKKSTLRQIEGIDTYLGM